VCTRAHADDAPAVPAATASPAPQSAAAPVAPATPPPSVPIATASSFHVDVGAGTYVPLSIGAEATAELPYRVLVQASVGWMPSPYSNTIVGLLGDFGAINSFEQNLIEAAIQTSLVVRLSAGWRPFSKLGLEALVGYTLLTAGGSVSGADIVDSYLQSTGSTDKFSGNASQAGIPLSATLHSVHVTVDWRFLLWNDRIVLRPSLAYLQCFASSTSVTATPARPAGQAVLNKLNADLQGYLNPYFTEYVKAPLIGLTASYRF
jgi:hypothetical protein